MRILPPLRGVVTMGANPGLSPGANFGQALRANSGNDFVSELISQETSLLRAFGPRRRIRILMLIPALRVVTE